MAPFYFCFVMAASSPSSNAVISTPGAAMMMSVNHIGLDLGRAPYVLYGVEYIDLVSPLTRHAMP